MFWLRSSAGWILARTKLARVERVCDAHGRVTGYSKRRLLRMRPLLWFSRVLPFEIEGLDEDAWLAWEIQLWRKFHDLEATRECDRLLMPALPGELLSAVLQSARIGDATKRRAFAATLQALQAAHGQEVLWPDGHRAAFSHGDAHARNVFYHSARDRAYWFDFEFIHAAKMTVAERHADDLRALAFSTAAYWSGEHDVEIAERIAAAARGEVRAALRRDIEHHRVRPGLLHLSQTPLSRKQHARFASVLLERIIAAN